MTIGPYPAALASAPAVHAHFVHHVEAARAGGNRHVTPPPDEAAIEVVITTGFWASLRREEGYVPRISLAFIPPQQTRDALRFDRALSRWRA